MSTGLQLARIRVENMKRYGYGRVSENRCPRRLARQRHEHEKCWCASWLNRNGGTYRLDGRKIVMWEPDAATGGELSEVFAAAAADGLLVLVHGRAPFRPGENLAIEFRRREVQR